jgi:hypothetical protein
VKQKDRYIEYQQAFGIAKNVKLDLQVEPTLQKRQGEQNLSELPNDDKERLKQLKNDESR